MNRRRFIKAIAGALAALPFSGWLRGEPVIANDTIVDKRPLWGGDDLGGMSMQDAINQVIERSGWVSEDTIVLPTVYVPGSATLNNVQVSVQEGNDGEFKQVLDIDYSDSLRPYANPEAVGYLGYIDHRNGTTFVALDGREITLDN